MKDASRAVVIVQARTGSTRLPGKVLKPLGPHTVLEEVLRRCAAVPGADAVCCATTDLPEDDAIVTVAARAGALVHRGSAADVLDRYLRAAEAVGAERIVRVTSDCPLIDPAVTGEVLALLDPAIGYACDNDPPTWPHGLDCEAFTFEALAEAHRLAAAPGDREHVTPWLRRATADRRVNLPMPDGGDAHGERWTLDYPEDYAFFVALFALLPPPPAIPSWREVLALVRARPDIRAINQSRGQR